MFRWLLLLVLAVAVGLGFIVGILNPQSVFVDLGFFEGSVPLGALMLLCILSGMLLALGLTGIGRLLSRIRGLGGPKS